MDDLPRRFVTRESSHRIHNPFTSEKLATLGRALYCHLEKRARPGLRVRGDAVHMGTRSSPDWHRG
jgi:hypothetical protein